MENAITKAIEGGYNHGWSKVTVEHSSYYGVIFPYVKMTDEKDNMPVVFQVNDILLDPLFWQALGKQQGWRKDYRFRISDGEIYSDGHKNEWFYHWHRFIDHIADGGDVEDFFNKLLK